MPIRVSESFDGNSESRRESPSKTHNARVLNPETLRRARESRYSREEEALSAQLARCSDEPTAERLQLAVLERARRELEARVRDYDQQARDTRSRLDEDQINQWYRDSLFRQRLVVEYRLASTQQELTAMTKEIEQLKNNLRSPFPVSIDRNVLHSAGASRESANLYLFFCKSATKRPYPEPSRPRSAEYVRDSWSPRSRGLERAFRGEGRMETHMRSRSLIDDFMPRAGQRPEPRSVSSVPTDTSCSDSLADTTQGVPAIDEFRNSFSSRVIPPARSRQRSSLRPLNTVSRERRSVFSYSRRCSVSDVDYGTVTILPKATPKLKTPPLDDFHNTPLPSYVHILMDNFEKSSSPSVSLGLFERGMPDTVHFQNRDSLAPVLEQASPMSTKGRSPLKERVYPNSPRKFSGKQRSIFMLRLPFRPAEPASGSRSTLAASSSTSVADFSISGSSPISESTIHMRTKGLPSTRDHDLAMLDGAPDDIQDPSLPPAETRPTKGRSSRSFVVLRRVRSRLGLAGRR